VFQLHLLHCRRIAGNVTPIMQSRLSAIDLLSSARMAAGMTSRARRPLADIPPG